MPVFGATGDLAAEVADLQACIVEEQAALLRQLIERVGFDGRTGKVTVSFKSVGIKQLCQK